MSSTPETTTGAQKPPSSDRGEFSLDIEERSIRDAFTGWVGKIHRAPGRLPSVLGLIVLALIFSQVSDARKPCPPTTSATCPARAPTSPSSPWASCSCCCSAKLSAGTAGGTCAVAAVAVFKGGLCHRACPP